MTSPTPIDSTAFANLVEMTGGDLAFVDDLVDTYLAEGDQLIADLETALEAGGIDDLVRPAHSLKSSSLNIGALVLGERCRRLEEAARSGEVTDADRQVNDIVEAFAEVRTALLDERGTRVS